MKAIRTLGIPFALLLLLVLAVTPAFAQSGQACITNASNTANLTGANNWQTLCGQAAVFAFDYSGNGDQAMIEMATNPTNSAAFYVYPQSQFNMGVNMTNPFNGGGDTNNPQFVDTLGTPIGAGTQQVTGQANADGSRNYLNNGNLMWSGASAAPGTYYILVQPRTNQNSSFWINATGPGVSNFRYMPAGAAPQTQLAMATTQQGGGTGAAGRPPVTLPRTGGEFEAFQLLAAGAALVSAGLFLRRRK